MTLPCHPSTESPRTDRNSACVGLALLLTTLVVACAGPQSALDPAGRDARAISWLTWWMTIGAFVIWVGVIALAIHAARRRQPIDSARATKLFIVGGGVVFPIVVLTVLLIYGLAMIPKVLALPPQSDVGITVSGEQWWWRVTYQFADGRAFVTANEIRLPVNRRTTIQLVSPDVIHSFWVPSLAGKMDMIPGRLTRLALEPTRTGVFRGACAEYCGASHALMSFYAIVLEQNEYDAWVLQQQQPATIPEDAQASEGRTAFGANGCAACHTVRGTAARGVIGPDLTHVGSRYSLAAGILPNETDDFARWIARTHEIKPGVHMPPFGMLPAEQIRALAAYLESLR